MKLRAVQGGDKHFGWSFWCPGCQHPHWYRTEPAPPYPVWAFNGDMQRPTFTPSLLNTCDNHPDPKARRCHLFVTEGEIRYCGDCSHDLAGRTVPLEDHWPDDPPDVPHA